MKSDKTAVDLFTERLKIDFGIVFSDNILEQYKEIEKNQIQNAFYRGIQEQTQRALFKNPEIIEPEEYYKNTFKKL